MESYYTPCKEFDACNELIERYWKTGQYEQCFRGHLQLAEKGYPLAECQVGYFYLEGIGVQKNLEKAFYWTERAEGFEMGRTVVCSGGKSTTKGST